MKWAVAGAGNSSRVLMFIVNKRHYGKGVIWVRLCFDAFLYVPITAGIRTSVVSLVLFHLNNKCKLFSLFSKI